MDTVRILKTDISVISIDEVSKILLSEEKITAAICNANTLVRCYKDKPLSEIINSFYLKCPDGFPVAKASKYLYKNNQKRVDGYNLFINTIRNGIDSNTSHYFFGNTEEVTSRLIDKIKNNFPKVNIAGYLCPPLLEHDVLVEEKYIQDLKNKNPDIIWVSLGFPKQERFINEISKTQNIKSNMIGIGAVFEWIAGTKYKAPEWIANLGLEWIFRLAQEPKRLFRRYLIDNFLFIVYFIKQYLSK